MPQRIDRKKRYTGSLNRKPKSKSGGIYSCRSIIHRISFSFIAHAVQHTETISLNTDQWVLPETVEYLPSNGQQSKNQSNGEEEGNESDQGQLTMGC